MPNDDQGPDSSDEFENDSPSSEISDESSDEHADSAEHGAEEKKPKKPKKEKEPELGNVKLIGIAGLVKEAQFSVGLGESVVVGRSSECNICLQDVPHAKAIEDNEQLEKHFRTVSRKHMRLTYHANDNIEIEDLSSNGLFLDGKRIEGKTTISDLVRRPYELKLGTTETFSLDWWKLVPKSSVKMVQVMVKREPEPEEEAPKKETGTIGEEF